MQRLIIDSLLMVLFISILALPMSAMGWFAVKKPVLNIAKQEVLSIETERKETTMPVKPRLQPAVNISK